MCITGVGQSAQLFDSNSPLDFEDLPPEYGGKGSVGFGESYEEKWLTRLIDRANMNYHTTHPKSTMSSSPIVTHNNKQVNTVSGGVMDNILSPLSQAISGAVSTVKDKVTNTNSKSRGASSFKNTKSLKKKGGSSSTAYLGKENRFVYDDLLCKSTLTNTSSIMHTSLAYFPLYHYLTTLSPLLSPSLSIVSLPQFRSLGYGRG